MVLMSYYPALKKAETFRLSLILGSLFSPVFLAILIGYMFNDLFYVSIGFIIGCVGSYFLIKLIHKYIKVKCPICDSPDISENYANSPRGSNSNVEHLCNSCNSKFIDGQLVAKNT